MLEQGRYTWRHNSVLSYIASLCQDLGEAQVFTDLGTNPHESVTTIPQNIVPTTQRPDLVIYWPNIKKLCIFELTIPFETNIQNAHQLKSNKYAGLVHDITDKGISVVFYAFELGSRGYLTADNAQTLKSLLHLINCEKSFKTVRDDLEKIVLCTSFSIYCSKCEPTWLEPSLFKI